MQCGERVLDLYREKHPYHQVFATALQKEISVLLFSIWKSKTSFSAENPKEDSSKVRASIHNPRPGLVPGAGILCTGEAISGFIVCLLSSCEAGI